MCAIEISDGKRTWKPSASKQCTHTEPILMIKHVEMPQEQGDHSTEEVERAGVARRREMERDEGGREKRKAGRTTEGM